MSHSTASSTSDLASTLARQIRAIFGKLRRRLREHSANSNLTPSQESVVLRLDKDGSATVSSLARAEGMRPQSMSAVVTQLQQDGLVNGAPDPHDGRQTLISLTPKCLKWLEGGRAARQDWLTKKITEKLSTQDQEQLRASLDLLMRLAEDE